MPRAVLCEEDPEACDHPVWAGGTVRAGEPPLCLERLCHICCVAGAAMQVWHTTLLVFQWGCMESVGKPPARLRVQQNLNLDRCHRAPRKTPINKLVLQTVWVGSLTASPTEVAFSNATSDTNVPTPMMHQPSHTSNTIAQQKMMHLLHPTNE